MLRGEKEEEVFRYGQIETALAKIHQIDESRMGAFRGAIIHLQRLGITPSSPGRGKKIVYTLDDALTWAFCLELLQFGLDPTLAKQHLNCLRYSVMKAFAEADHASEDKFLLLWPNVMSNRIAQVQREPGALKWNIVNESDLRKTSEPSGLHLGPDWRLPGEPIVRRFVALNLSAIKRELVAALSETDREGESA
jgi:hypothetical protein